MKPNLFRTATKELAHDGFFVWLLQWADKYNKQYEPELNRAAIFFTKMLLKKQVDAEFEIHSVQAGRKGLLKDVDLWGLVNDKYLLVIEDKTYTKEHSDQLAKYKKEAEVLCAQKHWEPIYIYLKTGSEAQSSLDIIEHQVGYACITRKDLISCFSRLEVKNPIFTDFCDYIYELQEREQTFEKSAFKDWNSDSWRGFYQFLEKSLHCDDLQWDYVANKFGGFWGCCFSFLECTGDIEFICK